MPPRTAEVVQPPRPKGRVGDEVFGSWLQLVDVKDVPSTELPPLVDTEALVGSLRDARLRVCAPFSVKFMVEKPHVVAEAAEFNEFGFGANWSEALADLQRAIAELYFTLEEEQERLGADLQSVWGRLQQKIQRL